MSHCAQAGAAHVEGEGRPRLGPTAPVAVGVARAAALADRVHALVEPGDLGDRLGEVLDVLRGRGGSLLPVRQVLIARRGPCGRFVPLPRGSVAKPGDRPVGGLPRLAPHSRLLNGRSRPRNASTW